MPSAAYPPSLGELREEIARLDHLLIRLVANRLKVAQRAIRTRTSLGGDVSDPAQERRVVDRARRWALESGVPPELVDRLFRELMESAKSGVARAAPSPPRPPTPAARVPGLPSEGPAERPPMRAPALDA